MRLIGSGCTRNATGRQWSGPRRDAYMDTIGRYPASSGAVSARSVQLYDEGEFTGYRLSVKVYDGVHAYGILLVPKGLKPGEKREEKEGVFLVSGRADIDGLKDLLHLDLNGSGFETVSGYVLDAAGRIPRSGDVIEHDGLRIEVVDADGQRINKVRFRLPAPGTTA